MMLSTDAGSESFGSSARAGDVMKSGESGFAIGRSGSGELSRRRGRCSVLRFVGFDGWAWTLDMWS
jgi:hypothetical protein